MDKKRPIEGGGKGTSRHGEELSGGEGRYPTVECGVKCSLQHNPKVLDMATHED